jgi:hypothetical protein
MPFQVSMDYYNDTTPENISTKPRFGFATLPTNGFRINPEDGRIALLGCGVGSANDRT